MGFIMENDINQVQNFMEEFSRSLLIMGNGWSQSLELGIH